MTSGVSPPWLGVEPRHLATFAAVAETGSFRAAAARFCYGQSGVSQHIAHLERTLGTCLIERGKVNRPLTLTTAGDALVRHAERIVQQLHAAAADLAAFSGERPLSVAVEPASASLVPDLLARLAPGCRDQPVVVKEIASSEHARLLLTGEIDLALGSPAAISPGLSREVLHVDSWVLVVPEHSSLADVTHLESLSVLRDLELIEHRGHPLPVDPQELGVSAVVSCDRIDVALGLVRDGAGYAVVPGLAVGQTRDGMHAIKLDVFIPPRVISLVWSSARLVLPVDVRSETEREPANVTPDISAAA